MEEDYESNDPTWKDITEGAINEHSTEIARLDKRIERLENPKCPHYWIKGMESKQYRCIFCYSAQDADAKTMHINNANHERF